jgi:hypothetical protein
MIIEIVSYCSVIIAELDRDYKISHDEWFNFIKKVINLYESIAEFRQLK